MWRRPSTPPSSRSLESSCAVGVRALAAVERFGSLAASAIAVLWWTLVSPRVAFRYLVVWTGIAVAALLTTARSRLGYWSVPEVF